MMEFADLFPFNNGVNNSRLPPYVHTIFDSCRKLFTIIPCPPLFSNFIFQTDHLIYYKYTMIQEEENFNYLIFWLVSVNEI